jgi:hypothetical protein
MASRFVTIARDFIQSSQTTRDDDNEVREVLLDNQVRRGDYELE